MYSIKTHDVVRDELSYLNTMFVGKVLDINHEKARYSVQPVLTHQGKDGIEIPPTIIAECPALLIKSKNFYIRTPYEVGDMVYVGINKRNIDEAITDVEPHANRMVDTSPFRLVDGVILGGLLSDSEVAASMALETEHPDDFIIQNRANKDFIVIQKTGGITIQTGEQVTVQCDTAEVTANTSAHLTTTDATVDASNSVTVNTTDATLNASNSATVSTAQAHVTASTSAQLDTATATVNATTALNVTSPMSTFTGAMTVTGALTALSVATAGASMAASGDMASSGSMTITGDITTQGEVTAGTTGIKLTKHKHPNGNNGSPTGPPTP